MTIMYRPMGDLSWKRSPGSRRASLFSAEWKDTLKLLAHEVELLGGEDITIELEVLPGAIRLDALGLKANQSPASPAVVVSFETKHGVLVYRNDALDSPSWSRGEGWRHNVRGIALTLEGQRALERYGASDRGQQYTGYAALPAGSAGIALGGMTRDEALTVLHATADVVDREPHPGMTASWEIERVWKRARSVAHPDRNAGDQAAWDRVAEAARVLGLDS